jgi:hypothetical protein
MRDLRTLTIGLLLGICVTLAAGPAAPNNPNGTRFNIISASHVEGGTYDFFIHDLQTNKVYYRRTSPLNSNGMLVEDILKQN